MRLEVTLDCRDLDRSTEFWAAALDYVPVSSDLPYVTLAPRDGGGGVPLVLQRVPEPKAGKLRMHLDLYAQDIEAEVARLRALGAIPLGANSEAGERWVVMCDPEGNEFCVCEESAASADP